MRAGAFALIDALGFKGIWGRYEEETILAKLTAMEKATVDYIDFANGVPQPVGAPGLVGNVHVAFLSDTIAMGCEVGVEPPDSRQLSEKGRAIITLVLHLSQVLKSAARTDPPFAYRGCISADKFSIKGRFILGPAVDRAAGLERLAEGAFVWLAPDAKAILEADGVASESRFPEAYCLHRTRVPLKEGRSLETFAVLPYGPGEPIRSKAELNERILSSFSDQSLDVVIKRDNTRAFLEAGAAATTAAAQRMIATRG